MPDWKKLVTERLGCSKLPRDVHDKVVAELAAHLEDQEDQNDDHYEDDRSHGLDESGTLSSVQWHPLARAIHDAKLKEESMNHRTKGLWLPVIVNVTVAAATLVVLDKLGVQPRTVEVSHIALAFHLPWLCTLPLSAAIGSLLAKRAQAPPAARLIAGLAPSLIWLAVFSVMALAFAIDRHDFAGFPLDYFAFSALGWIVLPTLALLLGTLPFVRESELQG
jgi:hypothetical protein